MSSGDSQPVDDDFHLCNDFVKLWIHACVKKGGYDKTAEMMPNIRVYNDTKLPS